MRCTPPPHQQRKILSHKGWDSQSLLHKPAQGGTSHYNVGCLNRRCCRTFLEGKRLLCPLDSNFQARNGPARSERIVVNIVWVGAGWGSTWVRTARTVDFQRQGVDNTVYTYFNHLYRACAIIKSQLSAVYFFRVLNSRAILVVVYKQ